MFNQSLMHNYVSPLIIIIISLLRNTNSTTSKYWNM